MSEFNVICCVCLVINLLIAFLLFNILVCYKDRKSKIDWMFTFNKLFEVVFSFYAFLLVFGDFFNEVPTRTAETNGSNDLRNVQSSSYYLLNYILPIYICALYIVKVSRYREIYHTVYNPLYQIKSFSIKRVNYKYELSFAGLLIVFFLQKYIINSSNILREKLKDDIVISIDDSLLFVNDFTVIFVPFFANFISFIYFILFVRISSSIQDKERYFSYYKRYSWLELLLHITHNIYSIGIFFLTMFNRVNIETIKSFEVYYRVYSGGFVLLLLIDNLLFLFHLFNSNFYHYYLSQTFLSSFKCFFGRPSSKKPHFVFIKQNAFEDSSSNLTPLSHFNHTRIFETGFSINLDRLELCLEDFEIINFDHNLNIVCSALDRYYQQTRFLKKPGEVAKENQVEEEEKQEEGKQEDLLAVDKPILPRQTFGLGIEGSTSSIISFYSDKYVEMFSFEAKDLDPSIQAQQGDKELKVILKSFSFNSIKDLIFNKEIETSKISKSLFSHFKEGKLRSFLEKDWADKNFQSREGTHSLNFNTFDNNLSFEFDDSFELENKNCFIYKYLKYVKDNPTTFLPLILGIFEIKINNFKPFKILLVKNKLANDIPKELYNSWDLIKINPLSNTHNVISTSRDNNSFLGVFGDEKEMKLKSSCEKIMSIYNINIFKTILMKDIELLFSLKVKTFFMLVVNYEFGINTSIVDFSEEQTERPTKDKLSLIKNRISVAIKRDNISEIKVREICEGVGGSKGKIVLDENSRYKELDELAKLEIKGENLGFDGVVKNTKCLAYFSFANVFKQTRTMKVSDIGLRDLFYRRLYKFFEDIESK